MKWVKSWEKLPDQDGVYLCELEGHYGIFHFHDGRFHPNDWGDYHGVNFESSYIGTEFCIIFWCHLPEFLSLTSVDKIELQKLRKERKKLAKKRKSIS